ncbi:hypothetical protein CXF85_19990 [Colwellia sp. 75C3]|uniref:hypothetical protein n=1 Tax=Colwellia sp. 75C3 TaxID=888425 RepID=UPI000C3428D1|nr:hypothetical protein [Colwellia sp. 75C3]PKG81044.1 hypothetical protein CXF85_19990 [Colwellia sp. 75C3]
MKMVNLFIIALIGLSLSTQAEISPLNIDQSQKKTKDKYIKSAHDVIKHKSSQEEVRFAILSAALTSKSVKWILEDDGDNFLVLRWDHSEAVIYTKVEFDEQYIQLKYLDAYDDYQCKNNVDGICYKNESRKYYGHMKDLRSAIINTLSH